MKNSVEDIWRSLKQAAEHNARAGRVPTAREAVAVVAALVDQARCSPTPSNEAIEYFARELIALSEQGADENARVRADRSHAGRIP